jgi:hypothetical protein
MAAALSRTDGTDCSSCSVVFERGMRWGFGGWWMELGGEGLEMGSMSRSKIADDDEWTDVGEDGMEFGEREPRRAVHVWRC